jgi:hypothetical protein
MAEMLGDLSREFESTAIYIKKPIGIDIKELIKVQKVSGLQNESKETTDFDG